MGGSLVNHPLLRVEELTRFLLTEEACLKRNWTEVWDGLHVYINQGNKQYYTSGR